MPFFELYLFAPGSNQPFASLPRSPAALGAFAAGETVAVGTGPALQIARVSHRCLPGPNNEPIIQTALFVSGPAPLGAVQLAAPWASLAGGDFVPWPLIASEASSGTVCEGVGTSLEEAVKFAHAQIPPRPHRDFVVSRVVGWGMQHGGFTKTRFYVQVVEDPDAPFRPDMPAQKQAGLLTQLLVGSTS